MYKIKAFSKDSQLNKQGEGFEIQTRNSFNFIFILKLALIRGTNLAH